MPGRNRSGQAPDTGSEPVRLVVSDLTNIEAFNFKPGHQGFLDFCRTVFAKPEPQFLRTDDDELVVFRHADLRTLAAMPAMGNVPSGVLCADMAAAARKFGFGESASSSTTGQAIADGFANQFFFNNDPIRAPLRRMTLAQIGPKAAPSMIDLARSIAVQTLAATRRDQRIDFTRDIAERFVVAFWTRIVGLSEHEALAVTALVRAMSAVFVRFDTPAAFQAADDAFAAYMSILDRAARRSLAHQPHPILAALDSGLAQLDLVDDPAYAGIVPKSAGKMLAGLLIDGFHTVATTATSVANVLAHRPEVLAQLERMPSLWPAAIAEALRLQPVALIFKRYTSDDVFHNGFLIPKHTRVAMMWAAGNHDPAAFPAPETYDLARNSAAVTSFGGGSQICPGRHMAQMLTQALLQTIACEGLELAPEQAADEWTRSTVFLQLRSFPVVLRQRST